MSHIGSSIRFVGYPRGAYCGLYGTCERMEALGEGYFDINFCLWIQVLFCTQLRTPVTVHDRVSLGLLILSGVLFMGSFLPTFLNIAAGMDWNREMALVPAIVMSSNLEFWTWYGSGTCIGQVGAWSSVIVSYFGLKWMIRPELERYGIKPRGLFRVLRKCEFEDALEDRYILEEMHLVPPVPCGLYSGKFDPGPSEFNV